jgi:hypothetical protein
MASNGAWPGSRKTELFENPMMNLRSGNSGDPEPVTCNR